jgi:hypothetical protein
MFGLLVLILTVFGMDRNTLGLHINYLLEQSGAVLARQSNAIWNLQLPSSDTIVARHLSGF